MMTDDTQQASDGDICTSSYIKNNDYYSYQERILLSPVVVGAATSHGDGLATSSSGSNTSSGGRGGKIASWNVRLETYSEFNENTWMHPFSASLQGIFEQFPQVYRILIQSSSSPSNTYESSSSSKISMDEIPILGLDDEIYWKENERSISRAARQWSPSSNRGPSGVFIHVHIRNDDDGDDKIEREGNRSKLITSIVNELVNRRLVVAPIGSSKYYDVIQQGGGNDNNKQTSDWMFQITLPTDGSQMSADAIQQSFSSFSPCYNLQQQQNTGGGSGILSDPTILSDIFLGQHPLLSMMKSSKSNILRNGLAGRRTMWLDLISSSSSSSSSVPDSSSRRQWKISQGVQYSLPYIDNVTTLDKWSSWILPGFTATNSNKVIESCPLVTDEQPLSLQLVIPSSAMTSTSAGASEHNGGYEIIPIQDPNRKNGHVDTPLMTEDIIVSSFNLDRRTTSSVEGSSFSIYKVVRRPYGISNRGRLETVVTNNYDDGDTSDCAIADIQLREIIPSFITPKWRSLQAKIVKTTKLTGIIADGEEDGTSDTLTKVSPKVEFRTNPSLFGGKKEDNRHSLIQEDALVRINTYLPPKSSLVVTLDYDPAFLTFEEFPGDPNRGMEVTPSIATFICGNDHHRSFTYGGIDYEIMINKNNTYKSTKTIPQSDHDYKTHQLYSNTLLILPPVPDMSMPFNVTSLTCSLFAYVIGSMVALLVKKSSERIRYKLYPDEIPKSKLKLLKERVKEKIVSKLFRRKHNKHENESEDCDPKSTNELGKDGSGDNTTGSISESDVNKEERNDEATTGDGETNSPIEENAISELAAVVGLK